MLDWLIIGGGIHGTALSHYLTQRKQVTPESVRVLDPHPEPLALWKRFTANTGMPYLRSPLVHHLHYDPWSARTFAQTRHGRAIARFIPLYERPSLEFFNAYSDWLITHYTLAKLRIQGRATELNRIDDGWQVQTNHRTLTARRVVLATGSSEHPHYPEWSQAIRQRTAAINHIFEPNFDRMNLPPGAHVAVIGGGISAAQVSLALMQNHHPITMISPHKPRVSHFDSDPCWVTSICLDDFLAEPDLAARRDIITKARQVGSMPPDVLQRLDNSVKDGLIDVRVDEVVTAHITQPGLRLQLRHSGDTLNVDYVLLATGFEKQRPGGEWLDNAINDLDLPLADDGYPRIDSTLCWSKDLFVMGPFAELEIGPVSRNIIGARLAANRIGTVI